MNINDLIERVSEYDNNLAKDLSEYVRGREYGLVFEASKPEFVRMWNKPVVRGDLVNILPPRGELENTKSDGDPAEVTYRLISKSGKIAKLRDIKTQKECEANVEDLVSIARFDQPIYCGLKEVDRVEKADGEPHQVVINGENYHALQAIAYAYAGKVDCIYIDPPYNTGAEDWKYNNNYVSKDDTYRHSKWLTFMEDRLKVAKRLLNPKDSVLIVTIDEKEYLRLGLLLEQIFPEARIQMISSVINHASVARFNEFNRNNEYIFFVMIGEYELQSIDDSKTAIKDSEVAWNTLRRHSPSNIRPSRPRQFYPIYINTTTHKIEEIGDPIPPDVDRFSVKQRAGCVAVFPVRDNGTEMLWGVIPSELRRRLDGGYVRVGKYTPEKPQQYSIQVLPSGPINQVADGTLTIDGYREDGSVIIKLKENKKVLPKTQWDYDSHDAKTYGSNIIKGIMGSRFSYPKSIYAVRDALKLFVAHKPNALVVDFFAGSGTTAHAVNLLNLEDGGHRHCICITNNEVSLDEQKNFTKKKLRQGDEEWEAFGIANYVTWPRVKCIIEGNDVEGNPLKGNYIDTDSPMADGFNANAIYFELIYIEPTLVSANLAFDEIAPLLWLRSGCKGPVIKSKEGYAIGETYAVLFDYSYVNDFVNKIRDNDDIQHIFIVTDTKSRYRSMCAEFPDRDVVQLYESYLRSFEINTEA